MIARETPPARDALLAQAAVEILGAQRPRFRRSSRTARQPPSGASGYSSARANASAAASQVWSIAASSWASETNQASNCEAGG